MRFCSLKFQNLIIKFMKQSDLNAIFLGSQFWEDLRKIRFGTMQSKKLQLIMNLEYVSENNILWSKYYLVINGGNTIFISDLVFESFQKGWFCWFLPIDSAALFTTTG